MFFNVSIGVSNAGKMFELMEGAMWELGHWPSQTAGDGGTYSTRGGYWSSLSLLFVLITRNSQPGPKSPTTPQPPA